MGYQGKKLIRDVKCDGFDYAIRFTHSRPCHEAIGALTIQYGGRDRQWGFYYKSGMGSKVDTYWRVLGHPLERSVETFFNTAVAGLALQGVSPNMTLEDFQQMLDHAKANPIPDLLIDGVRCEIRQMENFSVLFTGQYHKGLSMLIKDRIGTTYHPHVGLWEVKFVSTLGLKHEIMESLGFEEDQIVIVPGIYRITKDDDGKESVEEISDAERMDWEVSLSRRGGLFDDLDIVEEIAAMEADGGVVVSDEFDEIEEEELTEKQRLFLDITQRMKFVDVDVDDFNLFRKRAEKNCAKHLHKFKKFLPTQISGMDFLVKRTSGLLADDMGMGKTVCAVVAAGYLAKRNRKKVAIISNIAALDRTWRETVASAFPDDKIAMCEWQDDADWVVLNYEKLVILAGHEKEFEVVVFDEAHKVCCPESMRTQRAFSLSYTVPVRFLVTGTPILNTPLDLHTLLRLSGHPIGDIPVKTYMSLMDDVEFKDQIHAVLRTGWLIRRMKADWLRLKPKVRSFDMVPMNKREEAAFKKLLKRPMGRGAATIQMHDMRTMLAEVKKRHFLNWIKTLNKEDKVIVFCEYMSTVHDLQEDLKKTGHSYVTIYGQTHKDDRSEAQRLFEEDPQVRFFVGTSRAAGESITLVAANYVYFLTLPWTHGALVQSEDRAWRNGQEREVKVIIPLVIDSLDARQWAIIEGKEEMSTDLFTAKVEDEKANMESIMKLVLMGEAA